MSEIFISYQSNDVMLAQKVRDVLKLNGYETWFAPSNIQPGADYTREIAEHLESASMLILILSKYSMMSNWVPDEVAMAKGDNKPILAVHVDHEPLTAQFRFLLQRVQIIEGYQLENATMDLVLEEVQKYVPLSVKKRTEKTRFTEREMGVQKICGGDPYYEEDTTLFVRFSGNEFYLAPPADWMESADSEMKEWCAENGFVEKDRVFDDDPQLLFAAIPIPDLAERIEQSRRKIFSQFRNKENGCYFNNKKYGVENINPFGRTRDEREQPKLELRMFVTDYFTHRVMKDVCKALIAEGNPYLAQLNYTAIGANKIFFTSLGINLILLESSLREDYGVLVTSRSVNAAETYRQRNFSLSMIEGVSCSDYDAYQDRIRLTLAVERGLIEELKVTDSLLQQNTLKFYDFFVNRNNLEMGISCTVELKKEIGIEEQVLNLHGKDEELEIADKRKIPVAELETFIRNNKDAILPQAMFVYCSFMEKNGVLLIERFRREAHQKEIFVCAKDGLGGLCGDTVVDGEHFIAVIDGATPKGQRLWNGQRGDVFVSSVLARAIENLDPLVDGGTAIEEINGCVRKQYELQGIDFDSLPAEEQLQASVLIYSIARKEIWSFGDCMLRINQRDYRNIKKGDTMLSDLRAFCIEAAELMNLDNLQSDVDYGREQILPFLKQLTVFANSEMDFGYDVINGGEICSNRVKIYGVQPGDNIVMASDGYPKLFDSLAETEKYLQDALLKDPSCTGVLRGTKGIKKGDISYDDRSFISFTVSN